VRICYHRALFFADVRIMIETNQVAARIADLTERLASLRGYL
jgi:hypothetical protein